MATRGPTCSLACATLRDSSLAFDGVEAAAVTDTCHSGAKAAGRRRSTSLHRRRRLWLRVHRWLGLVAGALLVVISLSGSALVYLKEIDAWLNPRLLRVDPPENGMAAYRSMSELVAAAQAASPADARLGFAYYPRQANEALVFYASGKREDGRRADTTNIYVNPYTGQVTGTRLYDGGDSLLHGSAIAFLFKLHPSLLLGSTGSSIVGGLGLLFILSMLTGLILWWPITGKWRLGFLTKGHASAVRVNHDLHWLIGFYALPLLLAVLVSGVYLNLGAQFRWIVERFSPLTPLPNLRATAPAGGAAISIEQALDSVRHAFPDGRLDTFSLPSLGKGIYPYALSQRVPAGCCFVGRRTILLDRYSGKIMQLGDPFQGSGGDLFIQWQLPVHCGYAFGELGRIMIFLAGIGCTLLYATGVLRWLQKRRARSRAAIRLAGTT